MSVLRRLSLPSIPLDIGKRYVGSAQKFPIEWMGMGRRRNEMRILDDFGAGKLSKPPSPGCGRGYKGDILWGRRVLPVPGRLREAAFILRLDSFFSTP